MSLAITANLSVASLACACGTCAACAPRRVAVPAEPVAEAAGSRAQEDGFEASGIAPLLGASNDDSADPTSSSESATSQADDSEEAKALKPDEEKRQSNTSGPSKELTPEERQMVAELQLRDREVRAHEAAHKAAGGAHVGGASYTFQQGPDGRQYAIGGEVPVDLSTSGGSPEAVIAKMEQVRAAALAPGDPSSQDYAVAAAADALAAEARRTLQATETKELQAKDEQRSAAETKTGPSTAEESSDTSVPLLGAVSAQDGVGLLNGRAMDAYRKAQEAQFAQGQLNQRA